MKKKLISCLLCAAVSLSSIAQTAGYKYKAVIDSIRETGFYNIILEPRLNAHLKTDYSDLRIVNDAGKWIPHLLRTPQTEQTNQQILWEMLIVKNESNASYTELIVKAGKTEITQLIFTLRNTDVERFGNLTGSDDSSNWFIINDSLLIKPYKYEYETGNNSRFEINFSANNYRFYKLYINNKGKAPYNISHVGYHAKLDTGNNLSALPQFLQNPPATFIQKDSGRFSYIRVSQQAAFHTSKITVKLSGVGYFSRAATLFVPINKDHSFSAPGRFMQSFTLSNNSTLQFSVPIFNDSIFYLVVSNEDNLPLKLQEIKTYSALHVVTAYLEKAAAYSIIMNNASASLPNYDLRKEDIDLKKTLPLATAGTVVTLAQTATATKYSWLNNKWLLWLVIIAAACVLAFFTFKLVKDMNKNNNPS